MTEDKEFAHKLRWEGCPRHRAQHMQRSGDLKKHDENSKALSIHIAHVSQGASGYHAEVMIGSSALFGPCQHFPFTKLRGR